MGSAIDHSIESMTSESIRSESSLSCADSCSSLSDEEAPVPTIPWETATEWLDRIWTVDRLDPSVQDCVDDGEWRPKMTFHGRGPALFAGVAGHRVASGQGCDQVL